MTTRSTLKLNKSKEIIKFEMDMTTDECMIENKENSKKTLNKEKIKHTPSLWNSEIEINLDHGNNLKWTGYEYKSEETIKQEEENEQVEIEDEPINDDEIINNKKEEYLCTYCYKTFRNNRTFQQHFIVHTSIKPFACDSCPKKFKNINNLKKHKECVHLGYKKYGCEKCGLKFSELSNLRLHTLTLHDPLRKYQCEICTCRYKTQFYLEQHIQRAHRAPNNKCKYCTQTFISKSALKKHIHSEHRKYDTVYYCHKCKAKFTCIEKLKIHEKVLNISCTTCKLNFTLNCEYKAHIKTVHSNQLLYHCKFCEKTFTCKPGLLGHQWVYHNKTSTNYEAKFTAV